MKKLLFSIMLITLLAPTVYAEQNQSGNRQGDAQRGQRMAQLRRHLDHSDEQVAEMKKIRKNGGSQEEMRAVLTDEQRVKMDELRAQAKSKKAAREAGSASSEPEYRQPSRSDGG